MSEADQDHDAAEAAPSQQAGSKESAQVGKQLDSITDGGVEKAVDAQKATAAVQRLQDSSAEEAERLVQRNKALAAVKVTQEHVVLVAKEFSISTRSADSKLRENEGDLKATLHALLKVQG